MMGYMSEPARHAWCKFYLDHLDSGLSVRVVQEVHWRLLGRLDQGQVGWLLAIFQEAPSILATVQLQTASRIGGPGDPAVGVPVVVDSEECSRGRTNRRSGRG